MLVNGQIIQGFIIWFRQLAINQPAYSSGTLTFDSADTQFLQTTGQIELAGDFTIGFRVEPTTFLGTVLGDNTTANEFMKFNGASSFRVNIDVTAQNFVITSAGDDYYVLTRSGTTVTLHQNGTVLMHQQRLSQELRILTLLEIQIALLLLMAQ
jgi:hypothetical protein